MRFLTSDRPVAGRWDGVWIALSVTMLCTVLGQTVEWMDTAGYLVQSFRGNPKGDNRHVGYTPLLIGWTRALGWLPLSHYQACRLLSAVAVGVAALCAHAAGRTAGFARGQSIGAAALVGTAPAVLFHGTVVAPYILPLGLGAVAFWLVFAAAGSRGHGIGPAFGAGLVTGATAVVHGSSNLLLAIALPMLLVLRRSNAPDASWRSLAILCGMPLVGHAITVGVYSQIAPLIGWLPGTKNSADYLWNLTEGMGGRLARVPAVLWTDWIWTFMPISVLLFVSPWVRATRSFAIATLLGFGCYFAVTFILLQGGTLKGAYMMPIAWPAALLAARLLGARAWVIAALLALTIGVYEIKSWDDPERGASYATGLLEVTGGQPAYLVIGTDEDVEAIFVHLPEQFESILFLPDLIPALPRAAIEQLLPVIDEEFAKQRAAGKQVLFTAAARRWLDKLVEWPDQGELNAGPLFAEHLKSRYTLEPVEAGGFRAERLEPR